MLRTMNCPRCNAPVFIKLPKPLKSLDELVELIDVEGRRNWSIPKFPIVCLCGSVRFKKEFEEWACILSETKPHYAVLMPNCFKHDKYHSKDKEALKIKRGLDLLHWFKIKMADLVFIIDVEGYIGESTGREIEVAKKLGKKIRYMSEFIGEENKCLISL